MATANPANQDADAHAEQRAGGTHRNHGELRRIDVAEGQRIGQRERSVLGEHVHDTEYGQSEPLPPAEGIA